MKSQPHILLSSFEQRILRPLDFVFCGVALYYFWHHSWLLGAVILLLSLGTGAIGQGLPHRKHETTSELTTGTIFAGEFQGEISDEDSNALGRALFKACTLVSMTAALILGHESWKWYWILLASIAFWPMSLLAFLILTVGPINIVQNIRQKRRLY